MKKPVAYLLAILVHVAILFGITLPKPVLVVPVPERKYIEVTLFASPPAPAPMAIMPPAPTAEPPPLPPPPEPPPLTIPEPPPPPKTDEPVLAAKPEPTPVIESPVTETIPEPPTIPSPPTPALAATTSAPISVPVQTQPVTNPAPTAPATGQYINTSQPSFKNRVEPDYPLAARRQRQQGSVLLGLYINEQGSLDKVEILKSSGYPLLDEAAVEAMKESQFNPAYQDKIPVPSHAEVPITFRLE